MVSRLTLRADQLLVIAALTGLTASSEFGLTTYGEQCLDSCKQRGFPYAWCHKKPSWNGTYLNRDYCSPEFGKTRYLETCLDNCERREGKPFYWCHTHETNRGDWDFCSPFPGDSCQWSVWGSWGQCSTTCGPGSRTRRRRIEGGDGRVGDCSGETEVAFQACDIRPCTGIGSSCQWSSWSGWGQCSVSCGVGGHRTRTRALASSNGDRCSSGADSEVSPCPYYPCPDTFGSGADTTTPANISPYLTGVKRLLGEFRSGLHGVSGRVYLTPKQDKLLIEDFTYDGRGPDAFFWVGAEGVPGSRSSIVLPHPFENKFYDYRDPHVPKLTAADREDIVLTLPPQLSAYNIKWISVWCRQFSVDFGHVILEQQDNGHDFVLDPEIHNFITNISSTVSGFPASKEDSKELSNEIEDTKEDQVITVELPDLAGLSELPKSSGPTKGKPKVTFSIGNEIFDEKKKGFFNQVKEKQKEGPSGKKFSFKEKSNILNNKDASEMMSDEKGTVTVIRVETSVSEDTESHADDADDATEEENELTLADKEDNIEETATTTEGTLDDAVTTTEASDVTTDKWTTVTESEEDLIEVTLSNIDGVRHLGTIKFGLATTTPTTDTTQREDEGEATTTASSATTARPVSVSSTSGSFDLSRGSNSTRDRLAAFRNNSFRLSSSTSSPSSTASASGSLFRPSSSDARARARERLNALFNRKTKSPLRASSTTPTTISSTDKLFTEQFVTSTPKTRRFSIAPRFTTPSTGSEEPRGGAEKELTRPKIVNIFKQIPTDDVSENAIDDNVVQLSSTTLSPDELFSLIPKVSESATVKLGDFVLPVSTLGPIKTPISTISPRVPPLRTTPSPTEDDEEVTTRGGISVSHRGTTQIRLGVTPAITTTQTLEEDEVKSVTSSGRLLPSRKPGSLFTRRPGILARSTTVATPLTTPKLRNRKLQERIRDIFARRRSTTARPEVDEDYNDLDHDEDEEINELDVDSDLNDVNPVKEDKKKFFRDKFKPRPRRPFPRKFSPRPNLLRTQEPPTSFAPFTTPRSASDPPPETTRSSEDVTPKRMSDEDRFNSLTDFMKKDEGTEELSEVPRSSGFDSSKNDIRNKDVIRKKPPKRPWESSRVTTPSSFNPSSTPFFSSTPQPIFASSPKTFFGSSPKPFFGSSAIPFFTGSPTPFFGSPTPTPQPIFKSTPRSIFRSTDATLEIDLDAFDDEDYYEEDNAIAPVQPSTTPRFLPTISPTRPPSPSRVPPPPGFNPCEIGGSCGPNARCEAVNGQPSCSCPTGFSGIPRNGAPDPQHGCVRTPISCGNSSTVSVARPGLDQCTDQYSCVRDVCLQQCGQDTDCALGERCIAETSVRGGQVLDTRVCIKICFYDAHCLAGEYCEENVCRPGCRSDSNCPFGQICGQGPENSIRSCEDGCHFSNDCPIGKECRAGQCTDPCLGFDECGTNAVCEAVNHLPTCKCPEGYKELNSPYDACVPATADLTLLECLEDSDCGGQGLCDRGQCRTP